MPAGGMLIRAACQEELNRTGRGGGDDDSHRQVLALCQLWRDISERHTDHRTQPFRTTLLPKDILCFFFF